MNRRREAGFSFLEGLLHTFGVLGFVLFLSVVASIFFTFCIESATHHKLPYWAFIVIFIFSIVCTAIGFSKIVFGDWSDKISTEIQEIVFGFIWITGLLFFIATVVGLPFMMFLRKH